MGICFEEQADGRIVDVHVAMQHPIWVDEWRIGTYLRSVAAGVDDKVLHAEIEKLKEQGALQTVHWSGRDLIGLDASIH
jgi:hypothetical protein